jgi:hypothetical protein
MAKKPVEEHWPYHDIGTVEELTKRRRMQMLLHSCLYYELNENIISDETYDKWATELAELLPESTYTDRFDQYFEGWDGSTGMHLPLRDPWVHSRALMLLEQHSKR